MREAEVATDPVGCHRVLSPPGCLPQPAHRLSTDPLLAPDEIRVNVSRLNLDAASFRQLREKHDGNAAAVRAEVLAIIEERGKMQNPVTGSGGMLLGTVAEIGPAAQTNLKVGDRIATLVSLSLTPLCVTDRLEQWDGLHEQVPTQGHAILFGRTIAARLPDDIDESLALSVMDVCGAPALTARHVERHSDPVVAVIGAAGKSGSLCLVAAAKAGAARCIGVVPDQAEAELLEAAGLAEAVRVADARDPLAVRDAVLSAGGPADITVVCVDVAGCESGAILSTADSGTIIFFSMATSFTAAALGAEGLAADVTMLIGNGYVPGHAELALDLVRTVPGVRDLFERRLR